MRLFFFLINLNLGGTERSLLSLISALPENWVIDVMLLEKKGELLDKLPKNVNLIEIENHFEINQFIRNGSRNFAVSELRKGRLVSFLRNVWSYLLFKLKILKHPYYGLSKLIRKQLGEYDIAAAYAGPHDFITYYILNFVKSKKKYQWIHFDISGISLNSNFVKYFYPRYDKIFCVSQNAKDTFVNVFPQFESKTEVFENIVSEEYLKQQAEEGQGFDDDFKGIRILTVGRLSKEKGQFMIPCVVKKLKDRGFDFKWYLIGEGVMRKEIEEKIKKIKIEDRIILMGLKTNPYPFMKECDLYVQTSIHEGYCLTIHEAKIFEQPVVTTAVLSASNLITDGEDGLIVPIDENEIFEGISKLLEQQEKLKRLKRNLRKNASSQDESIYLLLGN